MTFSIFVKGKVANMTLSMFMKGKVDFRHFQV
jgi:hypothetical protein